jgi:hypothetical protein
MIEFNAGTRLQLTLDLTTNLASGILESLCHLFDVIVGQGTAHEFCDYLIN